MNEEIIILIKIILIDLVLSADNAIVIGMTASQFNDQISKMIKLLKDGSLTDEGFGRLEIALKQFQLEALASIYRLLV